MFAARNVVHCAATCISGEVGNQVPAPASGACPERVGVEVVGSAHARDEDVGLAPEHRFGMARGPTGARDVHVVGRCVGEVVRRPLRARARARSSRTPARLGAGDASSTSISTSRRGAMSASFSPEAAVVDHAARADPLQEIGDLARGVVVVHVARHDACLPAAEDRLDVLGPVVHEEGDAILSALPAGEVVAVAEGAELSAPGEHRASARERSAISPKVRRSSPQTIMSRSGIAEVTTSCTSASDHSRVISNDP